jgi:hypothetical protein
MNLCAIVKGGADNGIHPIHCEELRQFGRILP